MPGFEVKVIAPYVPDCEAADSRLPFPVLRFKNKLFLYLSLLIYAVRSDAIFITQRGTYATFAYWFNFFKKIPYVVAAHGLEYNKNKWAVIARNLNGAARVVPVSRFTADSLESMGVDRGRIEVINNGATIHSVNELDVRARHGLQGKALLLTVGHLNIRKGHDKVIEALPLIRKKVPNVHYLIVGEGPNRKRLEEQAGSAGLTDKVTFVGYVPDDELGAYYKASDLFIMLSRELPGNAEGFGIVYLEAGGLEKAVVAGRSGGTADAVIDGQTGVLVDPEDIGDVAAVVSELLLDPKKRERLGLNGKRRVAEEYTWDKVAKKVGDLLCRIVEKQEGRRKGP